MAHFFSNLKNFTATTFNGILDIVYPRKCLGCGVPLIQEQAGNLCLNCKNLIIPLEKPFCSRCGIPLHSEYTLNENHQCTLCLQGKHAFSLARSAVMYKSDNIISELILKMKYSGYSELLLDFAQIMSERYSYLFSDRTWDLLIPIPLHPKRYRKRGFNQAEELCRFLTKSFKIALDPRLLRRIVNTTPQSGNRTQRQKNIQGAFEVTAPSRIEKKTILLVDDVMTTGATVNVCSKLLLNHGAERVDVYTFARADHR